MEHVKKAMDHVSVLPETYLETWQAVHRDFIWVPSKGRYDRAASATNTERIESFKVGVCPTTLGYDDMMWDMLMKWEFT